MVVSSEAGRPRAIRLLVAIGGLAVLGWFFPLFHVVPLTRPTSPGEPTTVAPAAFDAKAAADKIWRRDLPNAAQHAVALPVLVRALRENLANAKAQFAKTAGVGAAYFFVRGEGKVVARERNVLRVAIEGMEAEVVSLRIGPVFGNTVRDGCGLLDVNAFPGLQEFNALSAELNARVEASVLPPLRAKAEPGTVVRFAGCAEAPESLDAPGEPVLTIVPVEAEIRR